MYIFLKDKKIITASLLIILFLLVAAIFAKQKLLQHSIEIQTTSSCGAYGREEVQIGKNILMVDIADTDCKKTLGLSGREFLGTDTGMLFSFDHNDSYGFWMKDMNFPLDIIWIHSDFVITGIEPNLRPDTYPQIYGEKYLAQYVLEVPVGYTQKNAIKVGDKISFSKKTL